MNNVHHVENLRLDREACQPTGRRVASSMSMSVAMSVPLPMPGQVAR